MTCDSLTDLLPVPCDHPPLGSGPDALAAYPPGGRHDTIDPSPGVDPCGA